MSACAKRGWIDNAGNGAGESHVYITPEGRQALTRVFEKAVRQPVPYEGLQETEESRRK